MRRKLFAAGRIAPRGDLAILCAWCGKWRTTSDRARYDAGYRVSHGICEDCAVTMQEAPADEATSTRATPQGHTPQRTEIT